MGKGWDPAVQLKFERLARNTQQLASTWLYKDDNEKPAPSTSLACASLALWLMPQRVYCEYVATTSTRSAMEYVYSALMRLEQVQETTENGGINAPLNALKESSETVVVLRRHHGAHGNCQ
ncbi:expressed unknown protein [Seminavis robusta]|uniref:Uncharacterized protein n=1 Tax=Seminavis robusta TaxID=568900 RepID=A0A9N8HSU4_9STRA|nr:expressed unknown protein [Seminavis robusta]|eukprot:Sro1428_g271860.1 n/a (121) ;mRNA; f:13663-14174